MKNRIFHSATISLLVAITLQACGGSSAPSQPPVAVVPPPPPPPPPPVSAPLPPLTEDVEYGRGATQNGDIPLRLDIYQPEGECTSARPIVLLVHGGGFRSGSKSGAIFVSFAEQMTERGFVVMSADYRLLDDNPIISAAFDQLRPDIEAIQPDESVERINSILAATEDIATALTWIEQTASEQCVDIDRLGVWGSSAGAFTVMQTTYALDDFGIRVPLPKAVIEYWGAIANPQQMNGSDAPVLIIHGTEDNIVSYDAALRIEARAIDVGVPHSFYTINGAGHGFLAINVDNIQVNNTSLTDLTIQFLDDHFSNNTPNYETVIVE